MTSVPFIAIGRNEGERLKRCLQSLQKVTDTIIYVDSGSTDGSCAYARSCGVHVVDLDISEGFTMARGRNAGLKWAEKEFPNAEFIHFIDGDCELSEGWLTVALEFMKTRPDVAVVCGRRRERHPEDSLYNRLFDLEWNTPVGETLSCGGDALMRLAVLKSVGGFYEILIAGEEPELCRRIRLAGWKIFRLDADITWHDAHVLHFSQWWKRHLRGGYGACDVARRSLSSGSTGEKVLFSDQVRSARLWTNSSLLLLGVAATVSLVMARPWILPLSVAALFLLWIAQGIRIGIREHQRAGGWAIALIYGLTLMLAKWPQQLGIWKYAIDARAGRTAKLIEYKNEP